MNSFFDRTNHLDGRFSCRTLDTSATDVVSEVITEQFEGFEKLRKFDLRHSC